MVLLFNGPHRYRGVGCCGGWTASARRSFVATNNTQIFFFQGIQRTWFFLNPGNEHRMIARLDFDACENEAHILLAAPNHVQWDSAN